MRAVPHIHVTGHRNPDTDSIAAAIGYAELRGRQDPENTYVPVRLGGINSPTRWGPGRARGGTAYVPAAHHAARPRRDAAGLLRGRHRRLGARGRPDDGPGQARRGPD